MEQSEKNIHFNEIALADIDRINVEVIARGDYPLAYRNLCETLEKRFDTALLRWRRREAPIDDMKVCNYGDRCENPKLIHKITVTGAITP